MLKKKIVMYFLKKQLMCNTPKIILKEKNYIKNNSNKKYYTYTRE